MHPGKVNIRVPVSLLGFENTHCLVVKFRSINQNMYFEIEENLLLSGSAFNNFPIVFLLMKSSVVVISNLWPELIQVFFAIFILISFHLANRSVMADSAPEFFG